MKKIKEKVSPSDLRIIGKKADAALKPLGVDMDMHGRHFVDRVNDTRNKPEIQPQELAKLINKIRSKKAERIKAKKDGAEAVLKDKESKINVPVIIRQKRDRSGKKITDVTAKTIMRKPDFKSSSPFIAYEGRETGEQLAGFIGRHLTKRKRYQKALSYMKKTGRKVGVVSRMFDVNPRELQAMTEKASVCSFKEYCETAINEDSFAEKSKKSGISVGTLKKVYNRGVAAWKTGHRPGTTPQQWGHARVNAFIVKKKKGNLNHDKDLA